MYLSEKTCDVLITICLTLLIGGCLAVAIAGCNQLPYDVDSMPRPYQDDAEQLVRTHLVYEMEMTDLILDYPVTVYWYTGDCLPWHGECVAGRQWNCDDITVVDTGCIGTSAFAHELGHCFRFAQGLGGDIWHWDKYFWGEIDKINKQLVDMEGCLEI